MKYLPNFLIVGGAKAGTTSLYHYLKQPPDVFMSPIKEPRFLTSSFVQFPLKGPGDANMEKTIIKDLNSYHNLFKDTGTAKAIGEASQDNLYFYNRAIPVIKQILGDVKIVIILRNPVDRAFSHYVMLVRDIRETLSFEDALAQEEIRRGKNWSFGWSYKDVGFYADAVRAYLSSFSNVKIYLYEDLLTDPRNLVKDLFTFIGVGADFDVDLETKYNVSGSPRNPWIQSLLVKPGPIKSIVKQISRFTGIENQIRAARERLVLINTVKQKMDIKTRLSLTNAYHDNILELQKIIGRDLSKWIEIP